jgi:hypothetical protein
MLAVSTAVGALIGVGALVLLAVAAAMVLKLTRAGRVKLGPVEIGREDPADQHGVNVSVEGNRFGGNVGDISGVKTSVDERGRRS